MIKCVNGVRVEPGEIRVASIVQVIDHDDCKIYNVDLHSKYAEVVAVAGSNEVFLGCNDRTLRPDENLRGKNTLIELPDRGDNWFLTVEGPGRYTVTIIQWHWVGEASLVWIDDAKT